MSILNKIFFLYSLSAIIASAALTAIFPNVCEIHDKNLGFVYNLTQLSPNHNKEDTKYDYPNETIYMQLCSPLIKKCNNRDGYAICLIKDKKEKGIGKFPPQVINENGKILFNFTGDNCLVQTNYTLHVDMQCDYQADNNSRPELSSHADEQCNLRMVWKTMLACGPRIQTNCTFVDNNSNEHFDLSPLTKYSENYVIRAGYEASSPKVALNVCHSIIRQDGALCPIKTGACLDDPKKPNKYSSLGEVQEPPIRLPDGQLIIRYQNGALCTLSDIPNPHVETSIIFICQHGSMETVPEYIRGESECHYQFIWRTAAACSIESLRNYSAITAGRCTITNPVTNFTYNLHPLMNKNFVVKNSTSGMEYKFSVCGPLKNNICKRSTGACDSRGYALGQANENLMWQQGGPYLNYTNGDLCKNGTHHYTIIGFFCGPEGSANVPSLVEECPCRTVIHWNIELVCEKRIKCATDNDDEINLSPLIRSANNYIVNVNGTEFHINICRSLVPTRSLTCAHGSAACKVSVTSSGQYTNEISLGFPKDSPTLNKDLRTVLRYIGGSQCLENPAKLISSSFTFICDNNNQGLPVYKNYVDCTYMFEWNTSIACGAVMGAWTSPCTIKDGFLSHEYDLSLLHKKQQIYYVEGRQAKKYTISICDGEKYCNGSAICHENNGYGSLGNVIFDYSRDDIKLKYTNGSKCNNNSYTSEVRFICNESMGIGAPKLLLELQCSAEFEWHTEVVCTKHADSRNIAGISDAGQERQSSSGILTEEFSPSHAGTVAGVVLTVIVVLAAIFYFSNPDKRMFFHSCTNLFSFRRGAGRVQYYRVNTIEEARLLLDASDPTQCQSDSDDDLLNA